jgi:hypothetical protein
MRERIARGDVRAEERAVIEVSLFFSLLFLFCFAGIIRSLQFQCPWGLGYGKLTTAQCLGHV